MSVTLEDSGRTHHHLSSIFSGYIDENFTGHTVNVPVWGVPVNVPTYPGKDDFDGSLIWNHPRFVYWATAGPYLGWYPNIMAADTNPGRSQKCAGAPQVIQPQPAVRQGCGTRKQPNLQRQKSGLHMIAPSNMVKHCDSTIKSGEYWGFAIL